MYIFGGLREWCSAISEATRGSVFIFPPWGGARFPPIVFGPAQVSNRCDFPSPPERGAVNPNAVHDHGQPTCQRHDRLPHPAMPGDLHCPGLEPG